MPDSSPDSATVTADHFREVIGHFATGVTVITTVENGEWYGTTASAVCSLSLEPPMLLVCMNRDSSTGASVTRMRKFAVNILTEHQGELAQRFAEKSANKFDGVDVTLGSFGAPLLAGSLAHVECRVAEEVSGGSHTVFLSEVSRASASTGTPLAYYRGRYGRLALGDDAPPADRGGHRRGPLAGDGDEQ